MDKSAQKALLDALTQHQAYLYRTSSQSVNELTKQFNSISNAQLSRLSELLEELTDSELKALKSLNFSDKAKSSKRIEEIKSLLNDWFTSVDVDLLEQFNQSALDLAIYEAVYTAKLVGETTAVISGNEIYKAVKSTPFSGGQLVDSLFSDLSDTLRKKVEYVIRDGISQGLTNQQIIQKIKGKKALDYKDGILASSRTSIERQVRTARSHVANVTYEETYKALGFTHLKFVATLDGRTSLQCASLDQTMWKTGDPAIRRPPLHPNCRSVLLGVDENGELLGKRPFVMDERKVKDIPKTEREGKIGQVDANTSFKDWFAKQDESFQEEWLGVSRYKLYKDGNYSIDKFVDPQGKLYSLDNLRKLDDQSFESVFKPSKSGKSFKQPVNELSIYDQPKRIHKPDVSTPARKKAVRYEDEIRENRSEYGAFIDKHGEMLYPLSGDINKVNIPRELWTKVAGTTFTHNHPGGSNFSVGDIVTAAELNLAEVRAVTEHMRFIMSKGGSDKSWPSESEIRQALKELNPKALVLTKNMVNSDMINLRHAQSEIEHQLWILVAQKIGLKYKRERS